LGNSQKPFRYSTIENSRVHTVNLSQNIFVSFNHVATGKELFLLVDTGTDISIVKENSDVFYDINYNYIIDV